MGVNAWRGPVWHTKMGCQSITVWLPCRYVFVEYGPMELDLNLRVRVHELEQHLQKKVNYGLIPATVPALHWPQVAEQAISGQRV